MPSPRALCTRPIDGWSFRTKILAGCWIFSRDINRRRWKNGLSEMNPRALLTLSVLPQRYAISQLDPNSAVPQWSSQGDFVSIARTAEELSIVCLESNVPAGTKSEQGWRILKCE